MATATLNDIRSAKMFLRSQLLQLGLGGHVVAKRATISVASAVSSAGRNVHAVGVGKKVSKDKAGKEDCVRVYVVQKLPLSLLSPRDVIPPTIDGVPTDVIESEPAFAFARKKKITRKKSTSKKRATRKKRAANVSSTTCSTNRKQRQRPVLGGISAGHRDITAGTLGCWCRSTNPSDDASQVFALSNNHVFANVDAALTGDPLYQPGPADGGGLSDYFAKLHRAVPIKLGGVNGNLVDAAIGEILPSVSIDSSICQIGTISDTLSATDEMKVRKHGRTTGYTEGHVDDTDYDALIGMDHGDPSIVALFENQLRIVSDNSQPFGLGGDSGSAVVHRTQKKVVGLYFAGPDSGMYGLANRIENVLSELEISIP